ncbi:MAG: nucleotidyltransferase family protein [Parcubacteria group bacterium]|nr:nucleotidyltransferase family protein [Parcubacteria group bacterium]
MKGFILASGDGTRLKPLTLEIPKPLLPVGKIPVITYLVNLYLKNGVNDIKVGIQVSHRDDFYKWKATYFPRENIELIVEQKPSGTFTPIAKHLNGAWFSEPIVVSNGDELKELNLRRMFEWHKRKKAMVTVGVVKVKDPHNYGVVRFNKDKILEFVEKPAHPPSHFINSGIYIMNPEVKDYYPKRAKFSMVEKDLFPILAKEKKLYGYKWRGRWMDIGTFERWEKAIINWKNGS